MDIVPAKKLFPCLLFPQKAVFCSSMKDLRGVSLQLVIVSVVDAGGPLVAHFSGQL